MFAATKYIYNKTRTGPKSGGETEPLCQHRLQSSQPAPAADDGLSTERTSIKTEDQQILPQSAPGPEGDSKCHLCQQQCRHDRIYRWKLICGLTLPYILSTLDLTIVATAVPSIASHFRAFPPPPHSPNTDLHKVLTVSRQIRRTYLDRHRVHSYIDNIHPDLRTACRRLRSACGAPARHVPDAGGEYAVRGGAELGDAFAG